jgi:hypothetical protein
LPVLSGMARPSRNWADQPNVLLKIKKFSNLERDDSQPWNQLKVTHIRGSNPVAELQSRDADQ